jgi:hypothetical protein
LAGAADTNKQCKSKQSQKEEGPWRKPPARQSPADGFIQREAEAFF